MIVLHQTHSPKGQSAIGLDKASGSIAHLIIDDAAADVTGAADDKGLAWSC